ncbi:Undecaprenyl-phosphate 4-deoxy-4-formamido-L-arabinose transferase [Porphyromonas macacae]|uniref:Undecaprenyl-phosphate 4-deoxy-4-formamido-L-arabinose transferase n=1 Tax=Porphyromonas macacae TaxID=28115 RepID=A0A379EBT1_9PORP|nr:Undecaprenyl-phosphate 4-deoxy-4-formamido-L-arabinose transferase [Porphyromonas macacae]
MIDISIVIPLYNEAESLPELEGWIRRVMDENSFTYEIIFVDDGSTDNSWSVIQHLKQENPNVYGIKFRRNYGKSPGLQCGFKKTQGKVVITMDADLQDSPDEIPELHRMITEEDYDLVSGWKKKRHDPILSKNLPSKLFNYTARRLSGIRNLHDFNCGLKAYRREVIEDIEIYNDMHRYIPYLAKNAGYSRIGEKVVHHQARKYGKSKFGISRFFNGYLDLITLWFTSKFGRRPMHFFGLIGTIMFLIGFIALAIVLINKFIALKNGVPAPLVTDRPYFFISLAAMILGTQLFVTGFITELMGRQNPHRNDYIIEKEL